jgi:hypothetical protein
MKIGLIIGLCVFSQVVLADGLPVITVQPTNQIVSPGNTATLMVAATGATSFQWRFNGTDISGATSATLQIPNAQTNNAGYYMAVAKNATGWVPSLMAWLSVVSGSGGVVPFSNKTNTGFFAQARSSLDGSVINNGSAQVVAGPALDQMQPVGTPVSYKQSPVGYYFNNGYFNGPNQSVPTVAPGQTVYYRVDIAYTNIYSSSTVTQQSAVLNLVAGGSIYPVPSAGDLKFPAWPEWPEPVFMISDWSGLLNHASSTATNQTRVPGESFSLTNLFWGFGDFGTPTWQWRKNGIPLGGPQNFVGNVTSEAAAAVLNITNAQPADAGIYDVVVLGNKWRVGPKTVVSIQITNGCGVLQAPRQQGTNFVCDLLGAPGRNYKVQCSTNLSVWNDVVTLSNATGMVIFSNAPASNAIFYRTVLLP